MADWTRSMQQTFEFFEVDPGTWKDKKRLTSVLSCTIRRDAGDATLETANIQTTEIMNECYVRIYLVTYQDRIRERFPLGTFLVQTPSVAFDGKVKNISLDAYSPLLELKDRKPDLGYTVLKNHNIMEWVSDLAAQNARAPVVPATGTTDTLYDNYTAAPDDNWLDYLSSLMSNARYSFSLDELGRILFTPSQRTDAMQPRWTFSDDNSSILYPSIQDDYDLYGIPNVIEVIYSGENSNGTPLTLYSRVVNDDASSPTSTVSRGREVLYRDTSPSISGTPNQGYLDEYAERTLRQMNEIQHTITYSHGYCPVRVGDCVRLNYERFGLVNQKARIVTQDITCTSGCVVNETAMFTTNLWKEE